MGGFFSGRSVQRTLGFQTKKPQSSSESICSSRTMSPEAIEISDDEMPPVPFARPKGKERASMHAIRPRREEDATPEVDEDVVDMKYELNDDLECQEVTKHEYEQASYHRIAKEVPDGHELVDFAPHSGGAVIVSGMSIELGDGDFLRVMFIIRNKRLDRGRDEAYTVRGILLRRYNAMDLFFPRRLNELCAIVLMPMDDHRPHLIAGLEDRPLTAFNCIREVVFTNAAFPDFSIRDVPGGDTKWHETVWQDGRQVRRLNQNTASVEGHLVCRYKSVKRWYKDRGRVKLGSNAFLTLDPDEADEKHRRSNAQLLKQWYRRSREGSDADQEQTREDLANLNITTDRGQKRRQYIIDLTEDQACSSQTVTPTSSKKRKVSVADFEVNGDQDTGRAAPRAHMTPDAMGQAGPSRKRSSRDNMITPTRRQLVSHPETRKIRGVLMDLFCGSGGASEAARMADLLVTIAVDLKLCAVRSHRRNHRQSETMLKDVSEFIMNANVGDIICDIIHSSNPCRYWSPMHTTAGKDDEANYAAAFMVEQAAKKFGCRIMSFEQTPGFCGLKEHWQEWRMWINQFTSLGFSVEWRIVNLADTGNAQNRNRLIIYATCPGQQMPVYPKATHGPPGSGLKPYLTVGKAISKIPAWATMHNPEELEASFTGSTLSAAEWDKPLQRLIATCGPTALHPSGRRRFTVRETLRLQGFPDSYEYRGDEGHLPPTRTAANAMAGDAVPPKAAAPFFAAMKEALRKTDEEIAAWKPNVISLDDD